MNKAERGKKVMGISFQNRNGMFSSVQSVFCQILDKPRFLSMYDLLNVLPLLFVILEPFPVVPYSY